MFTYGHPYVHHLVLQKKNEEQDALHFKRMKCTKQNYTFHFNHLSLLRNEANDINSCKCVLCVYVKIGHC